MMTHHNHISLSKGLFVVHFKYEFILKALSSIGLALKNKNPKLQQDDNLLQRSYAAKKNSINYVKLNCSLQISFCLES